MRTCGSVPRTRPKWRSKLKPDPRQTHRPQRRTRLIETACKPGCVTGKHDRDQGAKSIRTTVGVLRECHDVSSTLAAAPHCRWARVVTVTRPFYSTPLEFRCLYNQYHANQVEAAVPRTKNQVDLGKMAGNTEMQLGARTCLAAGAWRGSRCDCGCDGAVARASGGHVAVADRLGRLGPAGSGRGDACCAQPSRQRGRWRGRGGADRRAGTCRRRD